MKISNALKKSLTYRLLNSLLITPFIVFTLSGQFNLSLNVGIIELIVKILGYYAHEKIWNLKDKETFVKKIKRRFGW